MEGNNLYLQNNGPNPFITDSKVCFVLKICILDHPLSKKNSRFFCMSQQNAFRQIVNALIDLASQKQHVFSVDTCNQEEQS